MLSQALYWTRKLPEQRGGWFYKTQQEWEEETGLTRTEQETARRKLRALGILNEERKGNPCKMFFRVNFDALEKALQALSDCGNPANQSAETLQTSMQESCNLDGGEPANSNAGNPQTLNTETTNVITAETTAVTTAKAPARKPRQKVADRTDLNPLFQQFWEAYPKKVDPTDAVKAWNNLGEVTPDLFSEIMTGLARDKASRQWTKDGGQFIPHPATWINKRRWQSQTTTVAGRHGGFKEKNYRQGIKQGGRL